MKKRFHCALLIFSMFAAMASFLLSSCERNVELVISVLDVGDADTIVLKTQNSTVMIDTAERDDSGTVTEYLQNAGVSRIDMLIITHFDKDHVGGASKLINQFDIGTIYMPDYTKESDEMEAFDSAVFSKDLLPIMIKEDMSLSLDGIAYDFYAAKAEQYDGDEGNNRSIVVRVGCGKCGFLFCGDVEHERIDELLSGGYDLKSDFLMVPHHGKDAVSLNQLTQAVFPKISVITCSDQDANVDQTIDFLEGIGSSVYLTANGNITLVCDGEHIDAIQ